MRLTERGHLAFQGAGHRVRAASWGQHMGRGKDDRFLFAVTRASATVLSDSSSGSGDRDRRKLSTGAWGSGWTPSRPPCSSVLLLWLPAFPPPPPCSSSGSLHPPPLLRAPPLAPCIPPPPPCSSSGSLHPSPSSVLLLWLPASPPPPCSSSGSLHPYPLLHAPPLAPCIPPLSSSRQPVLCTLS